MPDIYETLTEIAARRLADPLAPVTVVAPSHASALQLRRRLASHGPFAAVRFEPLVRIAELIGAGELAAAGKRPLARPIGDYAAEQAARESRGVLAEVGPLPGYGRVLRGIFRRLRRAGIRSSADVAITERPGHLAEILRLYDIFREHTKSFYDPEDLLDAAAEVVRSGKAGVLPDLGSVYVAPPGPQAAAGSALIEALKERTPVVVCDEAEATGEETFVVAPDPASEAQAVVRMAIEALETGTPLHEIAVFHGAGDGYGRLLREAFEAADVPSVPLPGIPVSETRAGRGVLMLARLPETDYSRTATIDFLSVAPLKEFLPGKDGNVREMTTLWDKISREAGITHGVDAWWGRLGAFARDKRAEAERLDKAEYEMRVDILRKEAERADRLSSVAEALIARLEPLREPQPAAQFIAAFKAIVNEYLAPSRGLEEALEEIEQLGTVGAVGGEFTLGTFAEALAANLEARVAAPKPRMGSGVAIADYRQAGGMRFERVLLCGAFEGAFPAGPGPDAILEDRVWQQLKEAHPYIEDATARIERAREAASRAVAAGSRVTWSAPAYEPGGTREYYPSPLMAEAYSRVTGVPATASELRRSAATNGVLQRPPSPLAVALQGPALHTGELWVREAVNLAQARASVPASHRRSRAVEALRARRGGGFTEWDGNLSSFGEPEWFELQKAVSPTSLEHYASCGYRYFLRTLLRLQVVEEPDERQMMDAAERGSLVHRALERFFIERKEQGRPAPRERWGPGDELRLRAIADEELEDARQRGLTGLDVFAGHEARTIKADLARFLEEDTQFRLQTGAVPAEFEKPVPVTEVAGVKLRGFVDRIDRTPDGRYAWVIDYKTGSARDVKDMEKDPLVGGTKLQLPVYLSAAEAEEATALYWFISQKGGFQKAPYTSDAEKETRFRATLEAIVRGIGAGSFPAVPHEEDEYWGGFENCGFCDFDRICSRRRDLEFQAKAEDAGVAPWRNVARAAVGEAD